MNCKQDICHISKQIVKSIDFRRNDRVLNSLVRVLTNFD